MACLSYTFNTGSLFLKGNMRDYTIVLIRNKKHVPSIQRYRFGNLYRSGDGKAVIPKPVSQSSI